MEFFLLSLVGGGRGRFFVLAIFFDFDVTRINSGSVIYSGKGARAVSPWIGVGDIVESAEGH